jgi:hypothetical protein
VRIVSAPLGDAFGRPFVTEKLVGRDGVVWSAHPARDHGTWRIGLRTLYLDDGDPFSVFESERDDLAEEVFVTFLDVAEETLESTGFLHKQGDEGEGPPRFVHLQQATATGWRDHLEITLFAFLHETYRGEIDESERNWEAIDAIQQAAAATACELAASDEDPRWEAYDSIIESFVVHPRDDVVAAYARVTAAPDEGWIHAQDEDGWPLSSWRRPASSGAVFLASGVNDAEVTCRSYASPKRLMRPDASGLGQGQEP